MIMMMIINNVCKNHFYTIQDDRIIVGPLSLIRNANNLQVRCLQIRLQIGLYINLVYIFYTTNVYHISRDTNDSVI